MGFLKRALLAVTRRKSKFVILFVIFAVIANMVLAGIAIQQAADHAGVLARQKLGGQLTLRYNLQQAMQSGRGQGMARMRVATEPVPMEAAQMLAEHPNIIDYNYIIQTNGMAIGFIPVDLEENESDANTQVGSETRAQSPLGNADAQFSFPDVSVVGVSSTELLEAFSSGEAILMEGRHIAAETSNGQGAVIEKNLAELNGLKPGDLMEIQALTSEDTLRLTIIGIYESNASNSGGMGMRNLAFMLPFNQIYMDYPSAIKIKGDQNTGILGVDSAVFFVDDPKNMDQIRMDAERMAVDWEKFILDANDMVYRQMMGPIENVASFSKTVLWLVAIAGAFILALILILFIKERMYETGVLLSLGESKGKVIAQYTAEVLIIAVLAFGLSVFSGNFIARGFGDMLLNREVQMVEQQVNQGFGSDLPGMQDGQFRRLMESRVQRGGIAGVEVMDTMEIEITPAQVAQMSGLGLLILLLGIMVPALSIMRFNPKDILIKAI